MNDVQHIESYLKLNRPQDLNKNQFKEQPKKHPQEKYKAQKSG